MCPKCKEYAYEREAFGLDYETIYKLIGKTQEQLLTEKKHVNDTSFNMLTFIFSGYVIRTILTLVLFFVLCACLCLPPIFRNIHMLITKQH
jgi:hypothetical protein